MGVEGDLESQELRETSQGASCPPSAPPVTTEL